MSIRRNGTAKKRVIPALFPIPAGTDVFEYEEEEEDDEGDYDDDDDPEDKKKKKKKKKRKKKKKKKKRKKKKGKNKGKKGKGKKGKKKKEGKDDQKRPNSPKTLEVVKQTIRTKKDGSQVVDLTVDVDRIGRADKYEFRVVKKDNGNVKVITG